MDTKHGYFCRVARVGCASDDKACLAVVVVVVLDTCCVLCDLCQFCSNCLLMPLASDASAFAVELWNWKHINKQNKRKMTKTRSKLRTP